MQTIRITGETTKLNAMKIIDGLPRDGSIEVCIRKHQNNRTLAQNRLMHKWFEFINNWAFESTGQAKGMIAWKWYFKDLYLGYESFETAKGKVIEQIKSTAGCSTKELTEFLEKIDAHCMTEWGLQLPHPDDLYYEAMGIKREAAYE